MSEFKSAGFSDEFGGGPDLVGVTTMTSPYYFVPPSGSTAERPSSAPPGMLRFNTDIGRLEVWRNDHWATILGESPNLGDQNNTNSSGGTGVRGLTGGGFAPGKRDDIDFFTISTQGNSQDFGNLSESRYWVSSFSSRTRGIWGGGGIHPGSPNKTDRIDFVTISSTGNATDFGNLVEARYGMGACSNQTRGLFGGGYRPSPNTDMVNFVDYITIAQSGNAVDFGDLTVARMYLSAASSSTRGLFLSGRTGTNPYTYYDTIDYVTISSQGNALDFGNLLSAIGAGQAASNSTRAIYASNENTASNTIQYITISTTGNASDFGDLTAAQQQGSATASSTRGIISGGYVSAYVDTIQFVTITTTGNASDFGDLTVARGNTGSCSNGHGGL